MHPSYREPQPGYMTSLHPMASDVGQGPTGYVLLDGLIALGRRRPGNRLGVVPVIGPSLTLAANLRAGLRGRQDAEEMMPISSDFMS